MEGEKERVNGSEAFEKLGFQGESEEGSNCENASWVDGDVHRCQTNQTVELLYCALETNIAL